MSCFVPLLEITQLLPPAGRPHPGARQRPDRKHLGVGTDRSARGEGVEQRPRRQPRDRGEAGGRRGPDRAAGRRRRFWTPRRLSSGWSTPQASTVSMRARSRSPGGSNRATRPIAPTLRPTISCAHFQRRIDRGRRNCGISRSRRFRRWVRSSVSRTRIS